jgi:hypothetical protein
MTLLLAQIIHSPIYYSIINLKERGRNEEYSAIALKGPETPQ